MVGVVKYESVRFGDVAAHGIAKTLSECAVQTLLALQVGRGVANFAFRLAEI